MSGTQKAIQLAEGSTCNLKHCPSCDMKHDRLPIVAYAGSSVWTHWAKCPTTGDPVSLSIVATAVENDEMKNAEPLELDAEIMRFWERAVRSQRWLAAIWYLGPPEGGSEFATIKLQKKAGNFPKPDYAKCLQMLRQLFQEDGADLGGAENMPQAPPLRDLIQAFGNNEPTG